MRRLLTINGGPLDVSASQHLDYFGTVRGRVGYAIDSTLVYGTGGFAYGGFRERILLTNGGATDLLKNSNTETGYAIGGGIEHSFGRGWSAKIEDQYLDFGSVKLSGVSSNGVLVDANKIENNFQTVRLGLTYHFHSDYEPLK